MKKGDTPLDEFKKSEAYNKYAKKYDNEHPDNIKKWRRERVKRCAAYCRDNWITLATLIVAVFTLIATLLK